MKKFFSIILLFVFALSVFTACSKDDNQANNHTGEDSVSAGIKYTYDAVYADYSDSTVSAYESLCDAVVNYQNSVRMNLTMYDSVMRLFYTSFPLHALVKDIQVSEDNSGISITYSLDKEEHLNAVKTFFDKVLQMKEACLTGAGSKAAYVLNVYHYVASHIVVSEDESILLYDTVMNGEGSSYSYSNLFEYLLLQNDIPAYHVLISDSTGKGLGVSQFELNGMLYYADVMNEYQQNAGELLTCFGMTTQELSALGFHTPQYSDQSAAQEANDLAFDFCRSCTAWEIKDNLLLVTNSDGIVVEYAL